MGLPGEIFSTGKLFENMFPHPMRRHNLSIEELNAIFRELIRLASLCTAISVARNALMIGICFFLILAATTTDQA